MSRQGRENPLAHTLRQLGIGVLTPDSVEAYKARIQSESRVKLKRLQRKIKRAEDRVVLLNDGTNLRGPLGEHLFPIVLLGLLVCAIAVVGTMCGTVSAVFSWEFNSWGIVGWFALSGVMMIAGVFGALALFGELCSRERLEAAVQQWRKKVQLSAELMWATTPVHKYGWEIPEAVQGRMLQLREALPGVKFKVVHTVPLRHAEIDERVWALDPDPFLVACYRHEELHIAYWNEEGYVPRFK